MGWYALKYIYYDFGSVAHNTAFGVDRYSLSSESICQSELYI
jgi:hypothetical protein